MWIGDLQITAGSRVEYRVRRMNKLTKIAMGTLTLVGIAGLASAGDSKTPATGAPKATADAPKMDMTPPKELTDMSKSMAGTWKCSGQAMGMDMKMGAMTATMTSKAEMNGWWNHDSFDAKMGKDPFHFESYTTFDTKTKKFRQTMMEIGGGWSTGESAGMNAGKMDWDMTTHSAMMGDGMFRDHVDMTDAKAGVKMWGEASMDGGKTWAKVYDMSCKK